MEHYTDLAFRYIKMKKSRSILTVLGVSVSVMLLYIILNLGWCYVLNERADIRERHDYEIVLFTESGEQIETISSDRLIKDMTVGEYYKYDYESPIAYENAMYINTTNPYRMKNILSELTGKYGVEGRLNDDLAALYMQGPDGELMHVLILVYFLIAYIFAIFGVGIIRNSIQLTLFEQVKDFGNLRCIGSTRNQMQAVIFIQGAVLELFGIVIGTMLGTFGSMMGGELLGWRKAGFHFLPLAFVVLAFLFDLYFAMKENAKLVTGMSPVSAIRGEYRIHLKKSRRDRGKNREEYINMIKSKLPEALTRDISVGKKRDVDDGIPEGRYKRNKNRKGGMLGRLLSKAFGIEGEYAYKNIMRAPGRFFKIVTAMTFGVTAVIILSCGMLAVIRYDRKWQDYYGYYPIYVTWGMSITDNWADAVSRVPFTKLNNEVNSLSNMTEAKRVFVDQMLVANEEDFYSHFSDHYYKERRMDEGHVALEAAKEEAEKRIAEKKNAEESDEEYYDEVVSIKSALIYDDAVNVVGYGKRDMDRLKDHLIAGKADLSDEGVMIVTDDYMWTYDDRYSIDEQNQFLKYEHLLDYKIGDTIDLIDMTEYRKRYHDRMDDATKAFDEMVELEQEEYRKAEQSNDLGKVAELDRKNRSKHETYYNSRRRAIVEIYDELKKEGLYKTYKIEGILDENVISRADVEGPWPMIIVPEERFHEVTGREDDYFSGMMYHFDPFTIRQYEQVDWFGMQGDLERDGNITSAYDGYIMSEYPDWEYSKMAIRNSVIAAALISMFLVSMVVINYINNMASNIFMRRGEFAQLRVIGVSKKGLFKMVMLEGMIAAFISCVLGVLFGSGISYGFIMFIFRYYKDVEFTFPWIPALLSMAISVLILCGSVYVPLKRMPNDVAADLATAGE